MRKIGFIFPGQGTQYPLMGKDFFDQFKVYRETLKMASDILKRDVFKIIFEMSLEELTRTENSQIAIFITSISMFRVIEQEFSSILINSFAGLSLGEYSALVASGKIGFEDTLLLVQKRAEFMQEACLQRKGSMSAVLKIHFKEVEKVVEKYENVWIANYNMENQTVISGDCVAIKKVEEELLKQGAKIISLKVSGAFHCPFMQMAKEKLQLEVNKIKIMDTSNYILMNVKGDFAKKEEIRYLLPNQVTNSVRWLQTILNMKKNGIDVLVEVGPKKTLFNMNKKANAKDILNLSIEKVEDLKSLEKIC